MEGDALKVAFNYWMLLHMEKKGLSKVDINLAISFKQKKINTLKKLKVNPNNWS